jgi:hypothetical protein
LARRHARKRERGGLNVFVVLILVFVVAGTSVASVVAIAAGGAAGVTLATLGWPKQRRRTTSS